MSDYFGAINGTYQVSTDPSLLNISLVHNYLSVHSYWAQNIPWDVVEKSIRHSLCFGLYETGNQIGFARLITDRATFAYLADVFILEPFRGKGLSKWLLSVIQSHPELQGLRRWMLGTRDAHGLYEKFGWERLTDEVCQRFMQRHNKAVYKPLN